MEKDSEFQIGIKALIINKRGEVLLLKSGEKERKYAGMDFWDLPGGRIKVGFGIEDTLRREVNEELGISGEEIEIGDLFDATISNFKGSLRLKELLLMLIIYKCKLKRTMEFRLSDEHSDWRWVPIDEAKELLKIKFAKNFIDKLDDLKNKS